MAIPLRAGLEKVLTSPRLVTLLHICGVIPTPQSPVTPRDRRCRRSERQRLCIERRYRRIEWPPRDRRCRCPKRRRLHIERWRFRIERRYCRIEWRLFHDVSQCFKCFIMFYMCFMMFYNVLWCLASRAMVGVASSVPSRPLIASGIAITPQKSAITPQKSAMAPQGSSISPRTWSHAKLRPEWRLE